MHEKPIVSFIILAFAWLTPVSASAAPGVKAALDELGSLHIANRESDALLARDIEIAAQNARASARTSDSVVLFEHAFLEAESRQRLSLQMNSHEIARFMELEDRITAEKQLPTDLLLNSLRKYSGNPLFVLVVARIALQRHGDAVASGLKSALSTLDPGIFKVEWFVLARALTRTNSAHEFLPFYRHGLRFRDITFGKEEKTRLSSEELLWTLYATIGTQGEQAVLDGLASKSPLERRSSAMLAGSLLVEGAEPKLAAILGDDSDPTAQIYAARSLSLLLAYTQAPALEKAAASPIAEVRAAAVSALGELAMRRSGKTLIAATSDSNSVVRRAAIGALARYVDLPEVVSRLESIASTERPAALRSAAIAGLAQSPLSQATATLARLHKSEGQLPAIRREIERAMKEQILHVSRGTLLPQFTFYDSDGNPMGKQPAAQARKGLLDAIDKDGRFSARLLAAYATGLERQDIPTLKRARSLVARYAEEKVLTSEMGILNGVIRSILTGNKQQD